MYQMSLTCPLLLEAGSALELFSLQPSQIVPVLLAQSPQGRTEKWIVVFLPQLHFHFPKYPSFESLHIKGYPHSLFQLVAVTADTGALPSIFDDFSPCLTAILCHFNIHLHLASSFLDFFILVIVKEGIDEKLPLPPPLKYYYY